MVITEQRTYQFHHDRAFRLLQFTDLHHGAEIHPQTAIAMSAMIEGVKPDMVVLTGDCACAPNCTSKAQLVEAAMHAAAPCIKANVPWAMTMGNHDAERIDKLGMTKRELLEQYRALPGNINRDMLSSIPGCGNDVLFISRHAEHPDLAIWLFDSLDYPPVDMKAKEISGYGWISHQQVEWFIDQSKWHKECFKQVIPGLSFFHIPLPEYHEVVAQAQFVDAMNEPICAPALNSGLATAMLEQGNIMGMFVGHDHTNTFVGDWYGIKMGYGGSIGWGTYGLPEPHKHDLRGGRLFEIPLDNPASYETSYLLAADYLQGRDSERT